MQFTIRKAELSDRLAIESLIAASVAGLSQGDYTQRQIELSIRSVFGVDTELITDGTYLVAENVDGRIIGCGGWSKRRTLFGASRYQASRDSQELDPAKEAAKIRAFFIHPDYARQGVGTAILELCESEAKAHGFRAAEMMATLPGVRLYKSRGYEGSEEFPVPVGDGESIICVRMRKELIQSLAESK